MKIKIFSILFFFLLSILAISITTSAQQGNVIVFEMKDTIDQSSVEVLKEAINEAEYRKSEAVIMLLDTPGGGLQQTFDIADIIYDSMIPVVGFVFPSGSAAWSAGTFILVSSHVAVMADNTIIGSSQPVEVSIEGTRVINDSKTINALVKWIQERSNMYGRNETIAAEFITINRNVNETVALETNIIEYNSNSIDELLEKIDGISVKTLIGNVTLDTKNSEKIFFTPSFKVQFLKAVSNPILTSLLLMIGILALIFGISSPGFGAEVFGVIAILLSLVGSGFEISTLSIIFIIIGFLLFVIELFVTPGFGIIGIGGMISLVIGTIFLVPSYPNREWLITMDYIETAIILSLVVVVLVAIFFVFLLYKILQIRNKKKAVGTFIGEKAKTIDKITPDKPGYVRFKGEYWRARSDSTIDINTNVIIINKDETTLVVKPIKK